MRSFQPLPKDKDEIMVRNQSEWKQNKTGVWQEKTKVRSVQCGHFSKKLTSADDGEAEKVKRGSLILYSSLELIYYSS